MSTSPAEEKKLSGAEISAIKVALLGHDGARLDVQCHAITTMIDMLYAERKLDQEWRLEQEVGQDPASERFALLRLREETFDNVLNELRAKQTTLYAQIAATARNRTLRDVSMSTE